MLTAVCRYGPRTIPEHRRDRRATAAGAAG